MNLDVIIPVLNDHKMLSLCLNALDSQEKIQKIIVVDASENVFSTCKGKHPVETYRSSPGRSIQLNKGLEKSQSDIVVFLHADAKLPLNACKDILTLLDKNQNISGGAFRISTTADSDTPSWINPFLFLANFRSLYTKYPYGDQAIFVRRSVALSIGGFPQQEIFEDLEFSKKIWNYGRLHVFSQRVTVSGRRIQAKPLRSFLAFHTFPLLYHLGVSTKILYSWYRKIC